MPRHFLIQIGGISEVHAEYRFIVYDEYSTLTVDSLVAHWLTTRASKSIVTQWKNEILDKLFIRYE